MEYEFKWSIDGADAFDGLVNSKLVAPLITSQDVAEMEAVYYDTFDGQIAKAHGGLRMRRENGDMVCCLKLSPQSGYDGAYVAREEYQCYAPDIRSGMLNLPSVGAPQDFCDQILKSDLTELGRTQFTRHIFLLTFEGSTSELAFDTGKISHRGRTMPICEVELEYKDGSQDDFSRLALKLQEAFDLTPQPLSKLARMLRL